MSYTEYMESAELIINKITKNGSLNYQTDNIQTLITVAVFNGRFNYPGGKQELQEILEDFSTLCYRNGQLSTYPD